MSVRKILLFICACLVLLAGLVLVFPEDGITFGKWKLRFPDASFFITSEAEPASPSIRPEEQLEKMAKALEMKQLSELADSLAYYQQIFASASASIQFPNNDASLFDVFFAAMEQAQAKGELLRVLHYGDSQIEQDRITSTLRGNWQSRFGGMGCGLVPALQPVQTPYMKQDHSGDLQRYLVYGLESDRASHKHYGPMAQFGRVEDSARVILTPRHYRQPPFRNQASQIRVLVSNYQPGFQAVLHVGAAYLSKTLPDSSAALQVLTWQLEEPVSVVDLSFWGHADIQAIALDGLSGVAVDNIPMRGCSGTIFTSIDAASLREAYQALQVRMLILEFGGNRMPSIRSQADIDVYMRYLGAQIRYLKKVLPQAVMLFIGPADMARSVEGQVQTYPYLEEMIDALRTLCMENQVAFWDMYRVMGGRNTIIEWTKTQPPLAATDYIHFSRQGADRIAALLNRSFDLCYDYYCFRRRHINDSTLLQISRLDSTRNYQRDWEELLEASRSDSLLWQALENGLDSLQLNMDL